MEIEKNNRIRNDNNSISKYVSQRILILFLAILFFNGFLNNFVDIGKVYFGTLLIDIFYVISSVLEIIIILKRNKITVTDINVIFFIFFYLYFARIFLDSNNDIYSKFLSFRDRVFYITIFIFVQEFIYSIDDIKRIKKWLFIFSIFISLFGIFQYIFREHLSLILLTPKSDNIFSYYGTNIVRSTGLIGNPIIFGNFELLFYSIFLTRFFTRSNLKNFIFVLITFFAIIFTFSRVAYLGTFIITFVLMIVYIFKYKSKRTLTSYLSILTIILLSMILILVFRNDIINSFIYKDLILGNNPSVKGSTQTHIHLLEKSIEIIKSNWIFGTGIGTQRYGTNVQFYNTDGSWMAMMIEIGIPMFILYLAFLIKCIIKSYELSRKNLIIRDIGIGFFIFSIYEMIFANFINSAYFGKIFYIMYWFIFGIILSSHKVINKKEKIVNSINGKQNIF